MNKCMEGQRILDLCKAVREIHGYNSPQIALSWIRLIEETEEPLKLTSREFITAIKEMTPDVQNVYLKTIRNTGDIDMLTNVSFMSELKKMGKDDAALAEKIGYKVKVYIDSYENIKITTIADLTIAEAILSSREKEA